MQSNLPSRPLAVECLSNCFRVVAMVNELILAREEHRLSKLIASLTKHRLIFLDELGFIPFSANGAHLIFQLCSSLYERVAMIVTTNLRFAEWTQVFGDEQLTGALLDRLTHHAHIIKFKRSSEIVKRRSSQTSTT